MCLAASTAVASGITTSTSEQTFQIAGSPVTGQVLAAKLPLPANSKIVTLNMPTTQGGRGARVSSIFRWPKWMEEPVMSAGTEHG